MSMPAVNEAPLSLRAVITSVFVRVQRIGLDQAAVSDFDLNVAAKIVVGIATLERFRQRLNRQYGELAIRHELQNAPKIRATIPGKAAPTLQHSFLAAVTIEVAVLWLRQTLKPLLTLAAIGSEVRKVGIQVSEMLLDKRLQIYRADGLTWRGGGSLLRRGRRRGRSGLNRG